ncbi:phosphocarrier protein HPr [Bacillus ndiopicus]|uniref:phosphocarrier protein HPr n=1 Tax=Bacillus ndiopicus TaxID=1347368 RepID=UPI0005A70445|nr:phosphocarrier protein HPr [Bacillus ndiopicus]
MVEKFFKVTDPTGIHARPASLIVQAANNFKSEINIEFNNKKANLKSIMSVMALGIPQDAEIKIVVMGQDETEAMDTLSDVFVRQKLAE